MDSDALAHYHEVLPTAALRPYVQAYWTFRASLRLLAPYPHRVMPDGCASIVHAQAPDGAAALFYAGPRIEALDVPVPPGACYRGVRLQPGAAAALLHLKVAQAHAPHLPLSAVLPVLAQTLATALESTSCADETAAHALDRVLLPYARAARPLDVIVTAAVSDIVAAGGIVHVEALAARHGLSARQLQRRFRQAVGLTPKQFARIRRFREAVANVLRTPPDDWGRVAADHGFADQAHLTREFNALYGQPPGAFAQTVRAIDHGTVRP